MMPVPRLFSHVTFLVLMLLGVVVGTGSYVLFPAAMYALAGASALIYAFLVLTKRVQINIVSNLLFLSYMVFLLLNYLRDTESANADLYKNFALGLSIYLIITKIFYLKPDPGAYRYLPLLSLLVLATGILLQLYGYIDVTEANIGGGLETLLERPGGFLNPNTSAALGLVWLFIALESKSGSALWLKVACIAVCIFILLITQSRASILFFSIYIAWRLVSGGAKNFKYVLLALVMVPVALAYLDRFDFVEDLYKSNVERAQGDSSSDERSYLIKRALSGFADSPVVGMGMRAMVQYSKAGTHNEIVEWLFNFGLVGLAIMLLVFFRFYYTSSFKYVCMCLLPTFLFSHNFFETTAFQVALAHAFYLVWSTRDYSRKRLVWWVPAVPSASVRIVAALPFAARR